MSSFNLTLKISLNSFKKMTLGKFLSILKALVYNLFKILYPVNLNTFKSPKIALEFIF